MTLPAPLKATTKSVRLALEAAERHLDLVKSGEVSTRLYVRHGIQMRAGYSNAELLRAAQDDVRRLRSAYERRLLEEQHEYVR